MGIFKEGLENLSGIIESISDQAGLGPTTSTHVQGSSETLPPQKCPCPNPQNLENVAKAVSSEPESRKPSHTGFYHVS